jgi:hypothetical protein
MRRRIVASLAALVAFLAASVGLAGSASAELASSTATGSQYVVAFTCSSTLYCDVPDLKLYDTACDGLIAYGQTAYKDAYGARVYLSTHQNTNGCNGGYAHWSSYISADGRYGNVIASVGAAAWAGSNSKKWGTFVANPKF